MKRLELFGLESIGEIGVGDAVGTLISEACVRAGLKLGADDVVRAPWELWAWSSITTCRSAPILRVKF